MAFPLAHAHAPILPRTLDTLFLEAECANDTLTLTLTLDVRFPRDLATFAMEAAAIANDEAMHLRERVARGWETGVSGGGDRQRMVSVVGERMREEMERDSAGARGRTLTSGSGHSYVADNSSNSHFVPEGGQGGASPGSGQVNGLSDLSLRASTRARTCTGPTHLWRGDGTGEWRMPNGQAMTDEGAAWLSLAFLSHVITPEVRNVPT